MAKSKRKQRIGIGSDHAAYDMKRDLVAYLKERGYEVLDYGAKSTSKSVDYPVYSHLVAQDILDKKTDCGILLCGTGIGMSIAANRFKGIRAAVVHDVTTASFAASHNHANIICLGARLIAPALARVLVQTWLDTPRESRHKPRLDMIEEIAGC